MYKALKNRQAATLAAAATLALVMGACSKKTDTHAAQIMPVDVAQAVVDSVMLSKSYPGTLSSINSADIVCRVNGTLLHQLYNSGDMVKKGQPLFEIEDTQYRDAVQQAQAALANARSAYEYNSKHYAAMAKALESDAVAQIQVLQAKSELEQSQAQIKNAEAALQTALTNLSYCTVRAPFEGVMTNCPWSEGAYIGGEGQPVKLAEIYDNTLFYANFYIEDESYIRSLANENNRSKIDYDNVPVKFSEKLPHSYAGKLTYMAPSVDTGTGTLMVRVKVESHYGELRNGMYCTVDLPYKFEERAVMVKDAAISTSQTNKFVYVVNDSNRVVFTPVEVGALVADTMRIINSGLDGTEKYVTKALLKVHPGMEVKPTLTK